MSEWNWLCLFVSATLFMWWLDGWYRRLDATLTAKLKVDEAAVDALDRICGRLEVVCNEIAEANVGYDGDEWTTVDDDDSGDEWKLN